ncbi:MAG: TIGR03663 family protein [Dehalococcoidia bacterium]|nr:TIGR03663 family protein [Dehalococcoidia bacterium]
MSVAGDQPRKGAAAPFAAVAAPARVWARLHSMPRPVLLAFALVLALTVVAAILHFWQLGDRAFHHDESLHAVYSWYLAEGRGYHHDPLMHGPFLFHSTALTFLLFGDGDAQARSVPALLGAALIPLAWLLRDRIGLAGAVILAAMLTISPTILYFSRFARNDAIIAFWTLGMVIAIWRYVDRGQVRYLVATAALLALSFATKETTFITVALFLLYFDLYAAWQMAMQLTGPMGDARGWLPQRRLAFAALLALLLAPVAWFIVAAWPLIAPWRQRLGLIERTPVVDVLLVLGTFALPQFAAGVQVPLEKAGVDLARPVSALLGLSPTYEARVGLVAVVGLLLATAIVGLAWTRRAWLWCALAFYLIFFTLFTTFYTNRDGFASGTWGSLDYWLSQQDVRRGSQPAYYYLMVLPVYEFLPLLASLLAAIPLLLKGTPFHRFLLFWFGGTLFGLSVAGEKMPWLTVHLALPLAVIAAAALGTLVRAVGRDLRRPAGMLAGGGLALALLLGVLTARAGLIASFDHGEDGAKPVELLVYTQTSPQLLDARDRIVAYARESGQGAALPIYVDAAEGLSWPWAWYLRDHRAVSYADFASGYRPSAGSVAIVYRPNTAALAATPQTWREASVFVHRAWFPEVYRGVTFRSFRDDLRDGDSWRASWRYFYRREIPEEIGNLYAVLYLPAQ